MAIYSKKKKGKEVEATDVETTNEIAPADSNHDFKVGELGEKQKKQIADTEVDNTKVDAIPSANEGGREGGSKKKLQLALIGLVGLFIILVGIGVAVARWEGNKEAKRVAEAEETAQEQKKMATGGRVDVSEDKARIEMSQLDELPPPSGLQKEDGLGLQADNYEPITPVNNVPAYNPPTPEPAPSYEPVQAYNPPPVDTSPSNSSGGFFGGGETTASELIDMEVEVPLPKGADSDVLVDVNAIKTAQASVGGGNDKDKQGNGVGGNLNKTVLQNSSASISKSPMR